MAKIKILPIVLLLVGLAFILGALFSWADNLTAADPVGLVTWVFDFFQFLVGTALAAYGIRLSLRKKEDVTEGDIKTLGDQSPIHTGEGDIVQVKDGTYIKDYHAAPVQTPETHDTIGFIPSANAGERCYWNRKRIG